MIKLALRRNLLASTIIAGVLASAPGLAQAQAQVPAAEAAADSDETIVVTGSRINNPNLEQSSPVAVVTAEEFQFQQVTSAEELLRDIPGSQPAIGQNVNNGSSGQANLNLRGLGSNRNLVLIDGNRLVPATLGTLVDTNIIPIALLERVDVFTGGASTVYGADAIAGVVNFIIKRDFSGIELGAISGITEKGDGAQFKADLTIGASLDDGRGNVVLSMGYTNTDPVYLGDRNFSRVGLSSVTGAVQGSTTSVPITFRAPIVGQLNPDTGLVATAANTYNANPLNLFQTPLTRYNIYGKGRYDITDAIEATASGFFVKSKVIFNAAPSGIFANEAFLPLSNPFLPAGLRNQLCASDASTAPGIQPFATQAECDAASTALPGTAAYREIGITSERRFVEAGPRVTQFTTQSFQFNVGLNGPLTSSLRWDFGASYGESERVREALSAGFAQLQQSLRSTNTTTCTVTTGGCVPGNFFGPEGSLSQAAVRYLGLTTFEFVKTSLSTAQAGISGDFGITSPFAEQPIGIAVGVEHRKYAGSSFGDAIAATPGAVLGAGAAALPRSGEYESYEAYGEIIVPLITDRPFFHSLTLEAGARYSDYSTSGANTTYKVGGSWEPVESIKFRGMYSRAVRAPNLNELFQPQVVALGSLAADPCQGQITNPTPPTGTPVYNARLANEAALRALCAATGVPAALVGTGAIPAPSSGQIQTTQGGNPNLGPEVATTITAGVVFQPTFIPGFAITFDYYDILVTGAITNPTTLDVINGCYDATLNPGLSATNPNCANGIRRNVATGRLDGSAVTTPGVQLVLSNQGRIRTSGFDLNLNYRRDLGFARLNLAFNGNYTLRSRFKATPLSIDRECIGYYSTSCDPIQPEYVWNQRTTLSFEKIDLSLLWRHTAPAVVEPLAPAILAAYRRIPAYDYFDLSVRAAIMDNLTVTLTGSNIFDRKPPVVGQTVGSVSYNVGNTYPSNYDAIGRRFAAGVNVRF